MSAAMADCARPPTTATMKPNATPRAKGLHEADASSSGRPDPGSDDGGTKAVAELHSTAASSNADMATRGEKREARHEGQSATRGEKPAPGR